MVVDTSALVAIVQRESDWREFYTELSESQGVLISACTRLEAAVVMRRRLGAEFARDMERLISRLHIVTVPFDEAQLAIAMLGYAAWGRGRGKANLNFGDCFSYALAKARGLPLLYKGEDFRGTDVLAVI